MQAAGTFPEPDTIPDTVFAVHHLISEHLFEGQICIMAILKMSKLHLGCFGHLLGPPGPGPTYPGACILNDMPPCPKFRNTRVGSGVLPPRKRFQFYSSTGIKCFHSCGPKGYVDSWVNLDKVTKELFFWLRKERTALATFQFHKNCARL